MSHLLVAMAISVAINLAMFLVAFRYKSDKLTDISYAATFIFLAIYGLGTGQMTTIALIVFAMVVMWAGRLGSFLFMRIMKKGRDKRFDGMRSNFLAFGRFWVLQAVTVWIVSLPALLVYRHAVEDISVLTLIGVVIWLKGLIIEAIADLQKFEFSSDPANKGKWIERGIWRYSRHPNYFGEILVWSGIYLTALPVLSGNEIYVAALSPLFIATLLLFVSGIPILEKSADARWGENKDYRAYKKRTSLIIPLPNHGK